MNNKKHKRNLHNKSWGSWTYDAQADTLTWGRGTVGAYDVGEFDSADGALRWICQVHPKKWATEGDMKDLAKALSELNQCPGLAGAYNAYYHTRVQSKKEVIAGSRDAYCDVCPHHFACSVDLKL